MVATMTKVIGKERLSKQKYRLRTILQLQNRIEQINSELSGPGGMKYSDMPRSQTPFDKVGILVQEKMLKEKELNKILPKFKEEGLAINEALLKLSEMPQPVRGPLLSQYCDLLRYYYLEDKSWDDIMLSFGFEKDDDSKLRLVHKWHGKALNLLKLSQK
jgi:hypothetical protein